MKEAARQPCVLLVEDNPADVFLIRLLLGRVACAVELHVATDGEKALDLLDVRLDPPYLILLDLNLPKLDGWELLRRIKSRPERYFAPVVVLSSATSRAEVNRCYELGASAFVAKQEDPRRMERALAQIVEFWFSAVTLPQC